jgi:CheY-like chemotaxis protein
MTKGAFILVVDDNYAGQLLATSVLELDGFRVHCAESAAEVHACLADEQPDLILMDVQLPGTDGLSLTRQLKSDPATAAIPIVALTAHAMPGDRQAAIDAGCVGYITKPIDTRTLGDQVNGFLALASHIA